MRDADDLTGMSTGKWLCRGGQALPAWLYSARLRMVPESVEKFLDLGEEPGGFRVRVSGRFPPDLRQKPPLPLAQLLRRFHHPLDVHAAGAGGPQPGHAFALQAEHAAG